MALHPAPSGYVLFLSPAEREALLVALEYATGTARGDHANALRALAADLDADTLDRLADRVFLDGVPSAPIAAALALA